MGPLLELHVDAASYLHKLFPLFPEIAFSTGISACVQHSLDRTAVHLSGQDFGSLVRTTEGLY